MSESGITQTMPVQSRLHRQEGRGAPRAGRAAGPPGEKINVPENAPSSPGHVPIGQGTSRAFRNMFKRPDPPISRPEATFSLLSSQKEIGEVAPGRRPDGVPKTPLPDGAARGLSETRSDAPI